MKLLVPAALLVLGTGSGVGAALFVKEPSVPISQDTLTCENEGSPALDKTNYIIQEKPEDVETAFIELENQFVVPLVNEDKVTAIIVLSIGVEVKTEKKDAVMIAAPKLRDRMLQVLFRHANIGGFSENFTSSSNMRVVREELLAASKRAVGDSVVDVLILDIVRQES